MTIDRAIYLMATHKRLERMAIEDIDPWRFDAWIKSLSDQDQLFIHRINKADTICFLHAEDYGDPVLKFRAFVTMLDAVSGEIRETSPLALVNVPK